MTLFLRSAVFLVVVMLVLGVSVSRAQAPSQTPQAEPSAETLGENEHIPFLQAEQASEQHDPGSGSLILKTIGSMILIVGLIFAGAWAFRKFGLPGVKAGNLAGELELTILSTVSLGSGRSISTIRFGDRVLVVGSTSQEFTLLAEETLNEHDPLAGSRSVAELLADGSASFDDEFDRATSELDWTSTGANI